MYKLLLFTASEKLQDELEHLFTSALPDEVSMEVLDFPHSPLCIFPYAQPSAFLFDFFNSPEQQSNAWIQILCTQFSQVPALSFDGTCPLKDLVYSLIQDPLSFLPIKEKYSLPYAASANFLEQLTAENYTPFQINKSIPHYDNLSFLAALFRPEEGDAPFNLAGICTDLVRRYPLSFYHFNPSNGIFLFILYEPTANFTQLEIHRQTLIDHGPSKSNYLPPVKFGVIHHGLKGVISSFLEANQVYYVNKLQKPCTSFEEISSPIGQLLKPQKLMEIERSIRTDIQFLEGQNALSYIRLWFAECKSLHHELGNIKYDLIILYSSIKYTLFDMYQLKLKRIKSGLEVHEILSITSIEELECWFCNWLIYTLDNFDLTRTNTGFQIQEVLQFISNHVMDDLSLKTISSYFYVNPSYFSTLFKKETGQTYISYVTKLKMDKAYELLCANRKVYETAQMLGYEDIRHFRNMYKKFHGVLPSENKKKNQD